MDKRTLHPWHIVCAFVGLKLLIHLFSNTLYGFHRDEYLYLEEGNHLSWGYMEGPPMIGLLAGMAQVFGAPLLLVRFLPALAGALTTALIGKWVIDLKGGKWAVAIACGALVFSPAFLGSNNLFQPVSFNQVFWFLSAYAIFRALQNPQRKNWVLLGIVMGLGLMTKYSLAFFLLAWAFASILSPKRSVWRSYGPYLSGTIALLILLPNLVWQYQHNFPLITHMMELAENQLVHVNTLGFLGDQLLMQMGMNVVWIAGLMGVLFFHPWKEFREVGIAYLGVVILLLVLSGKSYYALGAYPMLFVFGGLVWESVLKPSFQRWALVVLALGPTLGSLPYALPLLPIEKMEVYCAYMKETVGLSGPLVWEDGVERAVPQDYADMHGWDELGEKVQAIYATLSKEEQENCLIYGGSYGHAGSINYHGKKWNLPEAYSLSASYVMWAESEVDFYTQILVDDRKQDRTEWFSEMVLVDSISHPYARDPGYIYLRKHPKKDVKQAWKEIVLAAKATYNFVP